ncbi:hypothetical protein [Entomobacter blattae]|uniref:Uncharacterized protein n=1 Tax=Entomobacter blattae TaxID=2762277 RepID=A0A7H1NQS5_9PROT|nr:hypothetical protein JGUZn3_09030 [Entomobacter blattae]
MIFMMLAGVQSKVADKLKIAHYVIDAEERFHTSAIQLFSEFYARGEIL